MHSLLYEEAPGFVVAPAFGGGQPQLLRDLRPIHVTLMAEVKEGRIKLCWRSWRNGFGFHSGIMPRMVHQRNAAATPGVCAIDLLSGRAVAQVCFVTAVLEVSGVTVLPGRHYPELINDDEKLPENSFAVPDAALADVSPALRPTRPVARLGRPETEACHERPSWRRELFCSAVLDLAPNGPQQITPGQRRGNTDPDHNSPAL